MARAMNLRAEGEEIDGASRTRVSGLFAGFLSGHLKFQAHDTKPLSRPHAGRHTCNLPIFFPIILHERMTRQRRRYTNQTFPPLSNLSTQGDNERPSTFTPLV